MRRVCDGVYATGVAAAPLVVLMLTFIALMEWNHEIHGTVSDELKRQMEREWFYSELRLTVVIVGSQLPALLIANTMLALRQRKCKAKHAALAGTVMFLLNCLLLIAHIYPQGIGLVFFFLAIPLAGAATPYFLGLTTGKASTGTIATDPCQR